MTGRDASGVSHLNAEGLDPQLMALDAHPRIELRLYNPFRNRLGVMRLLEMAQRIFSMTHRMHNKAWIVDGRVAIVGGEPDTSRGQRAVASLMAWLPIESQL